MGRSRAGRVTATGVALATLLAAAPSGVAASVLAPGGKPGGAPGASGNLLADGDAGAGYCTHDWNAASTIPGWTVTQGSPNVMCYPAHPLRHPGGAPGRGFFSGGPYGDSAMTQTASLRRAAGRIDAGPVRFRLSGWLGGWRAEPGHVRVTLAFLGRSGQRLGGLVRLRTVTAAERGRQSGFLGRSTSGTVPPAPGPPGSPWPSWTARRRLAVSRSRPARPAGWRTTWPSPCPCRCPRPGWRHRHRRCRGSATSS